MIKKFGTQYLNVGQKDNTEQKKRYKVLNVMSKNFCFHIYLRNTGLEIGRN